MYNYAKKYENHKKELKELYQDKEEELSFNPQINRKSQQMAENSQKNFIDRTMDKFNSKNMR